MAQRPYWKGQLRLALVSIPVEIYSAARSTARIAFHQIHKATGQRVRLQKTVPGVGPISAEDIAKGYEVERGRYVLFEEEELDTVRLESRRTLELTQFVDAREIDAIYYDKPYYVVPADELTHEAYGVLREALRAEHKVGLGQLAMRGREHVVSLKPCGRGMVLETLRYADELNRASSFFDSIPEDKPDRELLALATELVARKTAPFDPKAFRDRYVDAIRQMIEERREQGKDAVVADRPAGEGGAKVIDLMAALKRSVEARSAAPARAPAARKKAGKAAGEVKAGEAKAPAASAGRRAAKPAGGRGRSAA